MYSPYLTFLLGSLYSPTTKEVHETLWDLICQEFLLLYVDEIKYFFL